MSKEGRVLHGTNQVSLRSGKNMVESIHSHAYLYITIQHT